jgi:hypothetical protein
MATKWLRLLTILTMALFAAVWASTQQPSIPEPLAKIKAKYVGSKICFGCHIDVAKVWAQVPHSQWMLDEKLPEHLRGCEACHGPGSLHVVQRPGNIVAWSKLSIAEQNAICFNVIKSSPLKSGSLHLTAQASNMLRLVSLATMSTSLLTGVGC